MSLHLDDCKLKKPNPITDSVIRAIQAFAAGDYYSALSIIVPSVEETARKHYGTKKATRAHFIEFVEEKLWIIELFSGFGDAYGINRIPIPDFHTEDDKPKLISNPTFGEFIYYKVRCKLMHGKSLEENHDFYRPLNGTDVHFYKLEPEAVRFSSSVIFGLIAVVIFSHANKDLESDTDDCVYFYLTNYGRVGVRNEIPLDMAWGREDFLKKKIHAAKRMRNLGSPTSSL